MTSSHRPQRVAFSPRTRCVGNVASHSLPSRERSFCLKQARERHFRLPSGTSRKLRTVAGQSSTERSLARRPDTASEVYILKLCLANKPRVVRLPWRRGGVGLYNGLSGQEQRRYECSVLFRNADVDAFGVLVRANRAAVGIHVNRFRERQ